MVIDCHACTDGTTSDGTACLTCGGDGEIDLTDHAFRRIKYGPMKNLTGVIWSTLLTNQASIEAKIDLQDVEIAAIKAKTGNLPNDTANWLTILRDKIDAIKEVVDGL